MFDPLSVKYMGGQLAESAGEVVQIDAKQAVEDFGILGLGCEHLYFMPRNTKQSTSSYSNFLSYNSGG